MNRIFAALLAAALALGLTACSSSQEDLVSKTPFPEFSEVDTQGNPVSNDIFSDYDATIVNFWNNGCGTCIEEMSELEELYQQFKEENINLIGVASDSGQSEEQLKTAQNELTASNSSLKSASMKIEKLKINISTLTGKPTNGLFLIYGAGSSQVYVFSSHAFRTN